MITVEKKRTLIHVRFPWDPALVEVLRKVPEWEWDAKRKVWAYPLAPESVTQLLELIAPYEHSVDPEVHKWLALAQGRIDRIDAVLAKPLTEHTLLYERSPDLEPYQRRAVDFMATAGVALCGDDMGLGKTVEAIAALREMELRGNLVKSNTRRFLIVCPDPMKGTWEEHIEDWYTGPQLPIARIGSGRGLSADSPDGFYVINWDKLPTRIAKLQEIIWDVIIADETHRMKNLKAKRTQAMLKVRSPRRILLSGTPVRTQTMDIWPQLHFANPGRYASSWRFYNRHIDTIDGFFGPEIIGLKDEAGLQRELRTILIARKDGDEGVNVGLPVVHPAIRVAVDLLPRQRKAYNEMRNELVAWIENEREEGDDPDIVARNWLVQSLRLKQLAGTMASFVEDDHESAKADALFTIMDEVPADEKFVVMTQFIAMTRTIRHRLEASKTKHCIFTGPQSGYFDGEIFHPADRDVVRRMFQGDPEYKVFLSMIQIGGEGLTLTAARRFVFMDLDWTPGGNRQAWKRIHRKGQRRECFIYMILARDTIDYQAILPSLRKKQDIIDAVMGRQPKSVPSIGTELESE